MMLVLQLLMLVLASGGFTLAYYIHSTKKEAKPMVCPLNGNCDHVVHSEYGKVIGVPVETIGIVYYFFVGTFFAVALYAPAVLPDWAGYAIIGITGVAFLFSLYLTSLQTFVLKHWCTWCLMSAAISTSIFIITIYIENAYVLDFARSLFH